MIRRLTLNSLQSPELLPSGGHGQWRPSSCHAPLPPAPPTPGQSSLVAVTLTPAIAGDYSCLKVRLHFTRDKWFYYTTVFMPGGCGWGACPCLAAAAAGMILVTSSFVTFWIEWNAEPARVTLGVTTMLNFFTTSNKSALDLFKQQL